MTAAKRPSVGSEMTSTGSTIAYAPLPLFGIEFEHCVREFCIDDWFVGGRRLETNRLVVDDNLLLNVESPQEERFLLDPQCHWSNPRSHWSNRTAAASFSLDAEACDLVNGDALGMTPNWSAMGALSLILLRSIAQNDCGKEPQQGFIVKAPRNNPLFLDSGSDGRCRDNLSIKQDCEPLSNVL